MTKSQAKRVHDMILELEGYTASIDGAANLHRTVKAVHLAFHMGKLGTLARLLTKWVIRVGEREAKARAPEASLQRSIEEMVRRAERQSPDANAN